MSGIIQSALYSHIALKLHNLIPILQTSKHREVSCVGCIIGSGGSSESPELSSLITYNNDYISVYRCHKIYQYIWYWPEF